MSRAEQAAFADLLKRHRGAAGLTQEALAERGGVSTRSIRALERAESRPQKETARRLAAALGLAGQAREHFLDAAAPAPRGRARLPIPPTVAGPRAAPDEGAASGQLPNSSLLAGVPALPPTQAWADLPIPPTGFVGRAGEVAALAALLRCEDVRLVTLTGPGGVGKSRLALEVAASLQPYFADGIVLVSLAPLRDGGLLLTTIAASLGLRELGRQPLLSSLAAYLRSGRLLLLLDNFEHVAEAAADVAALQRACRGLTVLATSRVPLRLQGEHLFPVPPLSLPDPAQAASFENIAQAEAVRLFVQQARLAKPAFALDASTAPAVAAITRRLDGLPLAIELAAARIAVLSSGALLEHLAHPLDLLAAGARDLPERHQALRDTIGWSYDLLSAPEQVLFRQLAVCAGGCTLEAATAIAGERWIAARRLLPAADGSGVTAGHGDHVTARIPTLLQGLLSLVENSLLQVDEQTPGLVRFSMLDTIREYGLERLEAAREASAVRYRHAIYFLGFAEDAVRQLERAGQLEWLARLDQELDNLRVAFACCLETGTASARLLEQGLRVAGKLYRYWHLRGHYSQAITCLARLLAAPAAATQTVGRARALQTSAMLKASTGDRATAYTQSYESLAICRALGDPHELALALLNLGTLDVLSSAPEALLDGSGAAQLEEALRLFQDVGDRAEQAGALLWLGFRLLRNGDFQGAAKRFVESLGIIRPAGDRWSEGMALTGLAEATWFLGDIAGASDLAAQSLALHQEIGDQHGSGHVLGLLGDLAQAAGDFAAAHSYYQRSIAALHPLGEAPRCVRTLWGLAVLAARTGQPIRALQLAGAARALSQTTLLAAYSLEDERLSPLWELARQRLGPEESAAAWTAGQNMTLDQALTLALGGADPSS